MGDTFPPSLNVMDLRARHANSVPKMTSFIQEMGRMCRYQAKGSYADLPYALVGKRVMQNLREAIMKSAVFQSSYDNKNIDPYISRTKRTKTGKNSEAKASKHSSDYGNDVIHHNRLLLHAEPQIGKTGVFLKLMIIGPDP